MRIRYGAAVVCALAINSCNSGPGRHELLLSQIEIDQKDDARCRSYGAQPGTDAYISCRVEQGRIRQSVRSSSDDTVVCNRVGTATICN
jgi:hypothetical protein